ncbi:hypothetical protein EV580_6620 [Mycobacterium sp. BK086]|nr:hypothetical protein EV580_6620 [Mycobacterium sp. BK086]
MNGPAVLWVDLVRGRPYDNGFIKWFNFCSAELSHVTPDFG